MKNLNPFEKDAEITKGDQSDQKDNKMDTQ